VPATISAVQGVPGPQAGLASAVVNTSRLVGGALGLAVLAAIAAARTSSDLRHLPAGAHSVNVALTSGFHLAFAVAAGLALAGAFVAAFGMPRVVVRQHGRPAQEAATPVETAA
jgi:hypothetical protein